MRTFFVLCERRAWMGGLYLAIDTASMQSRCTGKPAQILVARPEQAKARVIAEADASSLRWISSGRYVPVKTLKRLISSNA
jgi:hypothetical protein